MRKFLLSTIFAFALSFLHAQVAVVNYNASTSSNVPFGVSNYHVSESIYTDSELNGVTLINSLAFSTTTIGAAAVANFGSVSIYLKDISSATTTLATGAFTTTGYTLVYTGSVSFASLGIVNVTLNTPFTRVAGSNLQLLIVRTDNLAHAGFTWQSSVGNITSNAVVSSRRYNNATTAPVSGTTSLTASAFRPLIRFNNFSNDARVSNVYTLGKLPIPNGTPHIMSANIANDGGAILSNVSVTVTITGANNFTSTKIIPTIAISGKEIVAFDPFTPLVEGTNTVTVTLASDDNLPNNSLVVTQSVNKNTWSYSQGTVPTNGVGFNGATGDFIAKFSNSAATFLSQVSVNIITGGQPFKLGMWDATGAGGSPGTLLWESPTSLTSATGVNVLPISPAPPIPVGDYYIGVRQTGTVSLSFAYQTENPIRPSTFYFTSPTGGTTWSDFAPNNPFRFMIEPKLILANDASVSAFGLPISNTCNGTPKTYTTILTNTGATAIAVGAAAVTLKVAGANTYLTTINNSTLLASGATETITFAGVNIANPGTNFDTLYVDLAGDLDKSNDTLKATNLTATTITAFPLVDKFENTTPEFNFISILAGGRNLTVLQNNSYTNVDLGGTLAPHSGTKMIIFDNFGGASSLGVRNRLYSNCLSIPAVGAGQCGNYQLSFWMSHDNSLLTDLDSLYVNISTDAGVTWNRITSGYGRIDAAFVIPGWKKEIINLSAYAGQTIQIGFEDVSKYGNIIGLDDIEIGSEAAGNLTLALTVNNGVDLSKTCDDNGWTYYADPADLTKALLAINWDPTNSGANAAAKIASKPRVQLDAADYAAINGTTEATYTMKRYWNVDLNSSVMTAPVNLRFFYSATDTAATNLLAANFATTNGLAIKAPSWFKTIPTNFAGDATHVQPYGVLSSIPLVNINTTGATINGILYAQFDGITSFSGGTYATGAGAGAVLPITIEYFTGTKLTNAHILKWKINCINTSAKEMLIEISSDGKIFTTIYKTAANSQQCDQALSYTNNKLLAGINYYRLKTVDTDGKITFSNIVPLLNADRGFEIVNITPNPVVENRFTLNITSAEKVGMEIVIADFAGRILQTQKTTLALGNNAILVNVLKLAAGSYSVYGVYEGGKTKVIQLLKK
jgi:hypothetical protein